MNTNIQALQALYVKLGGSLADTYEDIADGAPVSDYTVIPDMIAAVTQVAGSGGGGDTSDPMLPVMLVNALPAGAFGSGLDKHYYFNIRTMEQSVAGGMADITYEELTAQIDNLANADNKSALFLQMCFKLPASDGGYYPSWAEEPMKAIVNVEADSTFALWQQIAEIINNSPKRVVETSTWSGDPKIEAAKYIAEKIDGAAPRIAAETDMLDFGIETTIETATTALGHCPDASGWQRQMRVSFRDSDGKDVDLFCNPVIYKTPEMQSTERIAEVTFQYKGVSYTFRSPVYTYNDPGIFAVTWTKVTE